MMKVVLLLLAFSLTAYAAKPELAVYYESLCPYSRDFIRMEVYPAYQAVSEYLDVRFIAYGNAKTTGDAETGYHIECQHGERECLGNVVQACTVHYITDMAMQVALMNCMSAANRPEQAGPECFQQFQLDFEPVQACIDGPEGMELHVKNGEEHNSLSPACWGVPWPVWDGEGGDDIIDETDRLGVIGYLCEYFYNNELDVCNK